MRKLGFLFFFSTFLSAGCHGQVATVPQLTCPPTTTVGTYVNLSPSTIITATTYQDSGMASGASYCYIVQIAPDGKLGDGTSAPSNVAGPITSPTTSATHETTLSWTAPSEAVAGTSTYVVSRAAAISTIPTAPAVGTPAVVAQVQMPASTLTARAEVPRLMVRKRQ